MSQFRLCFRGTVILCDLGLQTRQAEREQSQAETQGRETWCGCRGLLGEVHLKESCGQHSGIYMGPDDGEPLMPE